MHELSLMQEIVDTLKRSAAENNIGSIKKVGLVVGKLVVAEPDSLQFCFSLLARGSLLEGAALEVRAVESRARCLSCREEFAIERGCPACSQCGSTAVEVVAGKEFYLDYYEGE